MAADLAPRPPRASMPGWCRYALLLLLSLVLYVPGLASLPVTDRDEARFAQATRQMLESGDFLRIRFQDEARNNKPAGIYWLQAASVAVLSNAEKSEIWPYRVPSLLGAVAAVLLTFAFGASLVGDEAAFVGAVLLATSLDLTIEAHLAKTDAVLLALTVLAQGALGRVYLGRDAQSATRRAGPLLFWLAQGAAILVKGPVTPALSLLTVLALAIADRDRRWLKALAPWWGVALLVVMIAPWLVAISLATRGAFLQQSVGQDFLAKLLGAEESHGGWPGTYLALVWLTFWPASLLLVPAGWYAWRQRREPAIRLLIAWALPFWVVLELVPTKLPNYLLPVFPALALMAGRALCDGSAPRWAWRTGAALFALASLLMAAALVGAPFYLGAGLRFAGLVAALVLLLYGFRIARRAAASPARALARHAVLLAIVVLPVSLAIEMPALAPLWLSRAAARLVAAKAPPGTTVAAAGYAEPSLVFLLGTRTRLVSPEAAARPGWALVESRVAASFEQAVGKSDETAQAMGQVAGLDYSNGRRMVLTLYRINGAR